MTPADEMRAAAAQLEKLAAPLGATAPWRAVEEDEDVDDGWRVETPPPSPLPTGTGWYVADELSENMARWVATLNPLVAAPLARWLDEQAERAEMIAHAHGWEMADSNATRNAVEIARVINGAAS